MKFFKKIIFVGSVLFSLFCLILFRPKILNKIKVNNQTRFESNFVNPLMANPSLLKYSPVKNIKELNYRINRFIIDIDSIEFAYQNIKLTSSKVEKNFIGISYTYKGSTDTVYAYLKKSLKMPNDSTGTLIIPGSGINQSSKIFYNNNTKTNYQSNVDDIFQLYGDVFILVKPNEDFLAIHNGEKKIGESSFVNYLINRGSSYSGYYFIQSLVLSKFIQEKYNKLLVTGISQGGYVALMNSLQSKPDITIIASGYSILFDKPHQSGHNQFILPFHNIIFNSEVIKNNIRRSTTNYLLTYGQRETGVYGQEANNYITNNYFENLKNVTTKFHKGGHVYDSITVLNFLKQKK